jgi:hypothetical protein
VLGVSKATFTVLLLVAAFPSLAVEIDGTIDPLEWQDAQQVTEFRKTQPFSGEPAPHATEVWFLSTPQGLAVAFRNVQPPEVIRTRQRVQRDFEEQVDRVNVMVDFDGDHRTGYAFTLSSTDGISDAVITNENGFNNDWDGNWQHAVSEDDAAWTAEILIPWHIAPMRDAKGDQRTLAIYFDRVIAMTGERMAWPMTNWERSRFLSEFAPVEVTNYKQSLLAVTPYISGLRDIANGHSELDGGMDVFWKPSGQLQLTATVNPDFGQVESDDLVVNFEATEVFVRDKRPFFTESQGIFEFTTPSDFSQLLYTRRVGALSDEGDGSTDITGALKLNGSVGRTNYGLFVADEAETTGRLFTAMRLARDFDKQDLGLMVTHVDRPFINREATVVGIDDNWRPTDRLNVRSRVIGSDVKQNGTSLSDSGATLLVDYDMDHGWRQQWLGMHFGNNLQINDAGYLARNSVNYGHWQAKRLFTDLPAASRFASHDWLWRASTNYNDHGQLLGHQLRIGRESQLRDGSFAFSQLNINSARVNDLLTRGNGAVNLPANFNYYASYDVPRKGDWAFESESQIFSGGLSGNHRIGYRLELTPIYFINDALNLYVGVNATRSRDWLVWQYDNLIGSFNQRQMDFSTGFNWTISDRQELRLKLEAIGIDARIREGYRVDVNGTANVSNDTIDDFTVSSLAFQIRYRFELAPLSYLYIVYGRGGSKDTSGSDHIGRVLGDSVSLHDDEQLLIKFSYRFEHVRK